MMKQEALDQLIYDAANAIQAALETERYVPSRQTVSALNALSRTAFSKRHTALAKNAQKG